GADEPAFTISTEPGRHLGALSLAPCAVSRSLLHRLQDIAVADRDCDASLYAHLRAERGLGGAQERLQQPVVRQLPLGVRRSALRQSLSVEPEVRGHIDGARAADWLSARLWH